MTTTAPCPYRRAGPHRDRERTRSRHRVLVAASGVVARGLPRDRVQVVRGGPSARSAESYRRSGPPARIQHEARKIFDSALNASN